MRAGEATLFHSLISTSLNVGLLDPLDICRAAEAAWRAGDAPLNAVEGFVRQILGWREFIRGIYWLHMPEYARKNELGATRKLPWLYWGGETHMRCMADAGRNHAPVCLRAPHPAADGDRQLRVAGRAAPGRGG